MQKMTYKDIIEAQGQCIFSPVGKSMLPLIKEGIDTVKLVKISRPLMKYDVILYLRDNGQYVLHRIIRVHGQGFDLVGDNQFAVEKNVKHEQVIALLDGVYKGEKYISTTSFTYLVYLKRTVWFRFIRKFISRIKRLIKKIFIKN